VRADEIRAVGVRDYLRGMEFFAGHHFVADPRQRRDGVRNRSARLTELLEGDATVDAVGETDHRQLDDLVAAMVQTGGFRVDEQAEPRLATVVGLDGGALRQTTHHAVAAGCFQRSSHRFMLVGLHSMIVLRRVFGASAVSSYSGIIFPLI
jgi:hypothetical protein